MLDAYRLELTVYGALHVGTGDENKVPAYAYVPDERQGRVYLLDTVKLLPLLSDRDKDLFIQAAATPSKAQQNLSRFWHSYGARLRPAVVREVAGSPAFFATIRNASERTDPDFRPLPVSLEGPYSPGSSVKGALRTAWLSDLAARELETHDIVAAGRRWETRAHRRDEGYIRAGDRPPLALAQPFEALLLGNLNKEGNRADHYRDPFRALRIGDSRALSNTRLERLGVVHENPQKRMNVTLLAETVPERTTLSLSLRYHHGLSERQGGKDAGISQPVDPEDLAHSARDFYGTLLQNEWDYAEDTGLENARRVYERLDAALQRDNELFPLRLGFGTGSFGNTLAMYMNLDDPKTRKTAGSQEPRGGVPLGWVLAKLTRL